MPETLPNVGIRELQWHPQVSSVVTESPFSFVQQVQMLGGQRRAVTVRLNPLSIEVAKEWIAFFLRLNGPEGTFYLSDIVGQNPTLTRGTPLVNGAGQTGSSLITDGWTASTKVLNEGEWIELDGRLYQVVNDVTADGSGNATLSLWPKINFAPLDNASIEADSPQGEFRLVDMPVHNWTVQRLMEGGTFSAIEAEEEPTAKRDLLLFDGAYTWHIFPLLVEVTLTSGLKRIYGSNIASDGTKMIQALQLDGETVTTKDLRAANDATEDDHSVKCIIVDPRNGYLYYIGTDHNAASGFYVFRSTTGDIADLTEIENPSLLESSYAQGFLDPDNLDKFVVFMRERNPSAIDHLWWRMTSTDEFNSHTALKMFRDCYVELRPGEMKDSTGTLREGWHVIAHHVVWSNTPPVIRHLFLTRDGAILAKGIEVISDVTTELETNGSNPQSANHISRGNDPAESTWSGDASGASTTTYWDGGGSIPQRIFENKNAYQDLTLDADKWYKTKILFKANMAGTFGLRIPGFGSSDNAGGLTLTKYDYGTDTESEITSVAGNFGDILVSATTGWLSLEFPPQKLSDWTDKNRLLIDGKDASLTTDLPSGFEMAIAVQVEEVDDENSPSTSFVNQFSAASGCDFGVGGAVLYDANDRGPVPRWCDTWQFMQDDPDYLHFCYTRFKDKNGCDHATLNNQDECVNVYGRLNLLTHKVEDVKTVGLSGDGMETTTFSQTGGMTIISPFEILEGKFNVGGSGDGLLVHAFLNGSQWEEETLKTNVGKVIMRPEALIEQRYDSQKLTLHKKRAATYQKGKGSGDGYTTWTDYELDQHFIEI